MEVLGAFGLSISDSKRETMDMPILPALATRVAISALGNSIAPLFGGKRP